MDIIGVTQAVLRQARALALAPMTAMVTAR
jgi:hypothetical protein